MKSSRIAQVLLIIIILFIVWWFFFGKKSGSESNFLTTRKGSKFCEKLCGGKDNKACMDECKTKEGFYGCC